MRRGLPGTGDLGTKRTVGGEADSARRNGDLAIGFSELAGAELLEGGQGPGGGGKGGLQRHR